MEFPFYSACNHGTFLPVPDPMEPGSQSPTPILGRALALAVLTLFVMVALGVFWVWRKAQREQAWRDRINATESFQAPPRR